MGEAAAKQRFGKRFAHRPCLRHGQCALTARSVAYAGDRLIDSAIAGGDPNDFQFTRFLERNHDLVLNRTFRHRSQTVAGTNTGSDSALRREVPFRGPIE